MRQPQLLVTPFAHWTVPVVVGTTLFLMSLPAPARASTFDTAAGALGGYALLRQGDVAGAYDVFADHHAEDPADALTLQGLAEAALYRGRFDEAAGHMAVLERQGEHDRVAYLEARQAHAEGRWSAALAGYARCLWRPGWEAWVLPPLEALYTHLGDLPFTALVNALAVSDTALADVLEGPREVFRFKTGYRPPRESDALPATPWQPAEFVAQTPWAEVEAAIRGFWAERDTVAATNLLNAAAQAHPRDARVQSLVKLGLLQDANKIPVPPARRKIPVAAGGAGAGGFSADLGILSGYGDVPAYGALRPYVIGMLEIEAASDTYIATLVEEIFAWHRSMQAHCSANDGAGIAQDMAWVYSIVQDELAWSQRETAATDALPVPPGFEQYARKVRELQDLRTSALTDLLNCIPTQDEPLLISAETKIAQLHQLRDGLVAEFLRAYDAAPEHYRVPPPEPGVRLEEDREADGADADEEVADGGDEDSEEDSEKDGKPKEEPQGSTTSPPWWARD
ncbi:MAG TPA: hypothetical protein VEI97_01220 [bacterium]|nr:hypothetical protein [bacterium]